MLVDYTPLFAAYDRIQAAKHQREARARPGNALQAYLKTTCDVKTSSGFQRMSLCRCCLFC